MHNDDNIAEYVKYVDVLPATVELLLCSDWGENEKKNEKKKGTLSFVAKKKKRRKNLFSCAKYAVLCMKIPTRAVETEAL